MLVLVVSISGCNLRAHPGNALGFFVPSQSPGDVTALAGRLGVEVEGMSGYTDSTSWSTIASYEPPSTALRLYLGLSMSPDNGSPAETPAHLGVFQQVAQNLVDAGQDYAVIRIGWEWNTDFYSWGVQNTTPAQYVTAFDDIVTTMRSVPGQHFLFDWCAANGAVPTNGSYAASYPGDQYVDYVGTDVYDEPATSWSTELNDVGGLASTVAFAQANGKSVSIPEWGLDGVDDPTFIDEMYAFIANPANSVAYSSYFSDASSVDSDITQFPRSEAEFTADFGS
ncbi:MAG: glycosyl hydrolase [Acidimicrobiales bacterium]